MIVTLSILVLIIIIILLLWCNYAGQPAYTSSLPKIVLEKLHEVLMNDIDAPGRNTYQPLASGLYSPTCASVLVGFNSAM